MSRLIGLAAVLLCLVLSACGWVTVGASDPCADLTKTYKPSCLLGKGGPNDPSDGGSSGAGPGDR